MHKKERGENMRKNEEDHKISFWKNRVKIIKINYLYISKREKNLKTNAMHSEM